MRPGEKNPRILFDTKKNLTRSSTYYTLPRVESYKQEKGGNVGTTFGPHSKGSYRPRFIEGRDLTRNSFANYDPVDVSKVRPSATGGRGTTFGPGLGRHVKERQLQPVNLLTSNAYLNYGGGATNGSDRFPHSGSAVFGRPGSTSSMGTPRASLTASWRGQSPRSTALPSVPNTPSKMDLVSPGKGRAHSPSFGSPASSSVQARMRAQQDISPPPLMEPIQADLVSPSPD